MGFLQEWAAHDEHRLFPYPFLLKNEFVLSMTVHIYGSLVKKKSLGVLK